MFANYAVFYTILQYICDIYMYHKASLKKNRSVLEADSVAGQVNKFPPVSSSLTSLSVRLHICKLKNVHEAHEKDIVLSGFVF